MRAIRDKHSLVLLITLEILAPLIIALTLLRTRRGPLRPNLGFIAMVLAQLHAVAAVGASFTTTGSCNSPAWANPLTLGAPAGQPTI